jgi:hypothetical protein
MNELSWISALVIGLAGSVHCAGMCGGIVTSFTFMLPKSAKPLPYLLAYNLGRILSYATAGGLAGYFGGIISTRPWINSQALPMIGGIFMILLGLYVGRWLNWLTRLETLGGYFWRLIRPFSKRFVPFRHPFYALPYGVIWGWLPCGLVYSTLTWSAVSGSAQAGFLTMFMFGLGTLPVMLAMGSSANVINQFMAKTLVRQIIAVMMCILGLFFTYRAIHNW